MSQIPGYMGRGPLRWLTEAGSRANTVVEVGAWLGRGTNALAKHCPGTVYCVDTWGGVPDDPGQHHLYVDTENPFGGWYKNCEPLIKAGKVIGILGTSLEVADMWAKAGQTADLVFLDADHRYEAIRDDIAAWLPRVNPGGVLAGHDMHWPGVELAVEETFGDDYRRGPGSIWWVAV